MKYADISNPCSKMLLDPQTVLPLFDVLHGTKHHKGVSDLNKSGNIIFQEL
ncbi:MAG: hypothetical protein ACLTS6_02490 [Anaerobutyricum sp.]